MSKDQTSVDWESDQKLHGLVLLVSAVAAHLLMLGHMPLFADEGIRATVSIEMILSGNFLQPTLWGEPYYYKTPLYNWILSAFMWLFGYSEFVFRLPSVLSLFGLSYLVYAVSRQILGKSFALYAALAFMLSGRLLTRDSMLGHIDLFFSLISFAQIYAIYFFHKSRSWLKLFVVSYALMSLGILMKGLPSIAFQALTLFSWFWIQQELKQLFRWQHLMGLLSSLLIAGSYFYMYSLSGEESLYIDRLISQSTERTPIHHSLYDLVLQLVLFPFENLAHLFPSSLFLIFLFRSGLRKKLNQEPFILFTLVAFVVNIIPYWLSPGYYPRYLFMLYPMPFILAFYLLKTQGMLGWQATIHKIFWPIMGVLMSLGLIMAPFFFDLRLIPFYAFIVPILVMIILSLLIMNLRKFIPVLPFAFSLLILFRLAFDLLVIPYRVDHEMGERVQQKRHAQNILEKSEGGELMVWPHTPLSENYAFYFEREKNQIIRKSYDFRSGQYFLMPLQSSTKLDLEPLYQFNSGYEDIEVVLVRFP